jgi:hypothetical protein
MKALISAFALLAFVGASTVPFVAAQAQAQDQSGQTQTTPKKTVKKAHKASKKKTASKKKSSTSSSSTKTM